MRGSAGSGVLNCMYRCVLVVGHFVWECEGSAGGGVLNFMYRCVLVVGQFVWECEGSAESGVLNINLIFFIVFVLCWQVWTDITQ